MAHETGSADSCVQTASRRIWLSVFLAVLGLGVVVSLVACPSKNNTPAPAKKIRIGVTQIATHPGIDMVREGFLEEMARQGFKEGDNVEYEFTNANGDFPTAQSIAKRFAASDFDLIFSISTPSTQTLKNALVGKATPLVFGAITDPVSAGIVESLDRPGGSITGTTDVWPIDEQLALLRRLVPEAKRIGVVHNPSESNSVHSVEILKKVAQDQGLELVLVPVSSSNEVVVAAQSLVGRTDAIYIPADNTVIAALGAMISVSERHGIPLMPGDTSNVQEGGFGTIGHDYAAIGAESAKIAALILNGSAPSDIPVRTSTVHEYYFNLRSAQATGVDIPRELLDQAKEVYGRPEDDS